MTREEKIVEARALRAGGCTYREIADRLGVSVATARRWLNPKYAEQDRRTSRDWKRRNKAHLRSYSRGYNELAANECPSCGGYLARQSSGPCKHCREESRHSSGLLVETLWREGRSYPEICTRMGWSKGHLAHEMHHLRAEGYDLPYRYRVRAPRFPEQVAA